MKSFFFELYAPFASVYTIVAYAIELKTQHVYIYYTSIRLGTRMGIAVLCRSYTHKKYILFNIVVEKQFARIVYYISRELKYPVHVL